MRLEEAYPGIEFRPRTRSWFARLMRVPPECVHLANQQDWMAGFAPDTLYLRGKKAARRSSGRRPEVSLCRACACGLLGPELERYRGRVAAFEPDSGSVSQYFFLAAPDFAAAGLTSHVSAAIEARLSHLAGECQVCARAATWLWFSRREVETLDDTDHIAQSPGELLCAAHGTDRLCRALGALPDANLFYLNAPYGDSGAYVWI
ncbi:MAG: hypothetical protein WA871_15030 [Candidatus Acidiferrales bacterium]